MDHPLLLVSSTVPYIFQSHGFVGDERWWKASLGTPKFTPALASHGDSSG